jgi:hypothetical protein
MEKTISLDQQERQTFAPLDMENMRLHARSDMLKREMEGIDARLAVNEEQQRSFIRDVVVNRGFGQFQNARFGEGGNIVITLPDEPVATPLTTMPPARPNGGIALHDSE